MTSTQQQKGLSEITCKNYKALLSVLSRLYEETTQETFKIPESLTNSKIIVDILEPRYKKGSVTNFFSAIIWSLNCLSRDEYSDDTLRPFYNDYREKLKQLKETIEKDLEGKEMELTEKEEKSFMLWEDIQAFHKELEKISDPNSHSSYLPYVILSLYVLHPPVRADYANMFIYVSDDLVPDGITDNYCVIVTNPRFVFQKYKTAKSYGVNVVPMNDEIHQILINWMGINYSDYLLTAYNPQLDEFRPISENALVKRVYNIFTKYKNKHVTINTLRHSYVSYKARNDQHLKEKKMVAKHMMHSTSMAETYRRSVYQK